MNIKLDRIHIFEVKSVNGSGNAAFDEDAYKEKIEALRECYKQASVITGHIFYLPIKKGSGWEIAALKNGSETMLTKDQFRDFIDEV